MMGIINLYETYSEGLHAIQELEAAKIGIENISLIVLNGQQEKSTEAFEVDENGDIIQLAHESENFSLAPDVRGRFFENLDLHDIEGMGNVIAAGWMVENLLNSSSGRTKIDTVTLIERLIAMGMVEPLALTYVEGIKHGGTLIGVKVDDSIAPAVKRIMREEHVPLDPHMKHKAYWQRDWKPEDNKAMRTNKIFSMLIANQPSSK